MSRISRWRWHGNAVARAGCLCYVASRWKVLWEASLCRRIMLTGTHASTRLTEERREGLNVCKDVFLFSACMCVCVYRKECKAWINNVRCAFALRGGYWYIYARKHPWTCQHACVCACVCGLKRSAYLSLTRPSVFQVGDFVSFPHSDPQSIDTRMKPNMHMLSSFHTQQRVRWLLRFPWCFLSTVYLCFTNVTLG